MPIKHCPNNKRHAKWMENNQMDERLLRRCHLTHIEQQRLNITDDADCDYDRKINRIQYYTADVAALMAISVYTMV